jgi:hypothetical protein
MVNLFSITCSGRGCCIGNAVNNLFGHYKLYLYNNKKYR